MYKMNLVALALLSVLVVMASAHTPPKVYYDLNNAGPLFESFIKEYNRQYKDEGDKELHYQAFLKNLASINKMNQESPSATFGINKFADYTDAERKTLHGYKPVNKHQ